MALQQIEKGQAKAKTELLATCSKKQPTIAQVLESRNPYAFDHPRSLQIHRLLWGDDSSQ